MKKNIFIGIDLGATTLKVGAFNSENGECAAFHSAETALITPEKNWAEYDAVEYPAMLKRALRAVCDSIDCEHVGGVAVSSQGQACVLVDQEYKPVRDIFVWLDSRAVSQAEKFFKLTGQKVSSFASAAKWMWVAENEPHIWAKTAFIMMLPEYVGFLLSGERVVDRDTAASTKCVSETEQAYNGKLLSACGVAEEMLGRIAAPCDVVGRVTRAAQAEYGIPEGTPVIAGTNDQLAGAIGAGNDTTGVISGTVGTSVALIANLGTGVPEGDLSYSWNKYPIPGQYYALTFGKTGAAIFTWFKNNFAGDTSYSDLIASAMRVSEGSDGMVCIPHFQGVATPSFRDDVRGAFLNISMHHKFGHFARSVMEAVCFSALDNFDLMLPAVKKPKRFLLLGGASQSDDWMQMICDILGVEVELPAQGEAATLGAALIASVGAGFHPDLPAAIHAGVNISKKFQPDIKRREKYLVSYKLYREAMEKLYKGAL